MIETPHATISIGGLTSEQQEVLRAELAKLEGELPAAPGPSPITDPDQLRADIGDHTAYPSLDDQPNGADVFAGVHPVAGLPESEPMTVIAVADDPLRYGNAVTVTSGMTATVTTNGHTEPSPAAVATLGPEHTVVTPIVPRRPRTLAEVDGSDEGIKTLRMGADERAAQLREIVGRLQDMADHGEMPSMAAWDERKPAHLPKADAITKRWDFSWGELAAYCRLKFTGKRVAKSIGR